MLRIVEAEAKLVRAIYTGYLKLGSLVKLASRLNKQGYTTKRWVSSRNRSHGGRPLSAAFLHRVLTNPVYTGHIVHVPGRKAKYRPGSEQTGSGAPQMYRGKHEPIIDQTTWDRVRAQMVVTEREKGQRWTHTHLLKGKLRTFEDYAMSPGSVQRPGTKASPAQKRRVRYYISQKAIKQGYASCPIKSINAEFLDGSVRAVVLRHLASSHDVDLQRLDDADRDRWIRDVIGQVVIAPSEVSVDVALTEVERCRSEVGATDRPAKMAGGGSGRGRGMKTTAVPIGAPMPCVERADNGQTIRLVLAVQATRRGGRRILVGPDGTEMRASTGFVGQPSSHPFIVQAIGQAFAWHRELMHSGASIESFARMNDVDGPWVHRMLALTQLSPAHIRDALIGTPTAVGSVLEWSRRGGPIAWAQQRL